MFYLQGGGEGREADRRKSVTVEDWARRAEKGSEPAADEGGRQERHDPDLAAAATEAVSSVSVAVGSSGSDSDSRAVQPFHAASTLVT